jgi:hypothetical protein
MKKRKKEDRMKEEKRNKDPGYAIVVMKQKLLFPTAYLEHLEFSEAQTDVSLSDHKESIYRPGINKMSCSVGSPQSSHVYGMIQSVQDWNLLHQWQIL